VEGDDWVRGLRKTASEAREAKAVPRILVINGHSNAGKTTLCAWLGSELGFTVVDCDKGGIDSAGLRVAWDAVERGDAGPLREELVSRGHDAVVDWPYNPPHGFSMVRALRAASIPAWWLDADVVAAETSFRRRGTGSVDAFRHHALAVGLQRNQVHALYGSRYLVTLGPGGARMDPRAIWDAIRAAEGWPVAAGSTSG